MFSHNNPTTERIPTTMAKNNRTAPIKIAVKVVEKPEAQLLEPETLAFAAELEAKLIKANKPVYAKKLRALKDEYATVVMENEEAFARERADLEARYTAVRNKNSKEFLEKVQVLKDTYRIR